MGQVIVLTFMKGELGCLMPWTCGLYTIPLHKSFYDINFWFPSSVRVMFDYLARLPTAPSAALYYIQRSSFPRIYYKGRERVPPRQNIFSASKF